MISDGTHKVFAVAPAHMHKDHRRLWVLQSGFRVGFMSTHVERCCVGCCQRQMISVWFGSILS